MADPVGRPYWSIQITDPQRDTMFNQRVYTGGGMVLQFLKEKIGDDKFFELMRTWFDQHKYGNANSEQLRTYLGRMDEGIAGLEAAFREVIGAAGASADFDDFLKVLARDAAAARAALRIVLTRKGISSQLVDNLNVSTHLRAVLTDLFLLDEAVKGLR